MAQEMRLPAERRDQWFYCRAFVVVARINAHPKNESEWASINAEIEQVRALNPKNYLGEYLRNLASERQGSSKKAKVSKAMVVRGSAPEDRGLGSIMRAPGVARQRHVRRGPGRPHRTVQRPATPRSTRPVMLLRNGSPRRRDEPRY